MRYSVLCRRPSSITRIARIACIALPRAHILSLCGLQIPCGQCELLYPGTLLPTAEIHAQSNGELQRRYRQENIQSKHRGHDVLSHCQSALYDTRKDERGNLDPRAAHVALKTPCQCADIIWIRDEIATPLAADWGASLAFTLLLPVPAAVVRRPRHPQSWSTNIGQIHRARGSHCHGTIRMPRRQPRMA